jgi:tetratricopeptide (TPR) repeat protein
MRRTSPFDGENMRSCLIALFVFGFAVSSSASELPVPVASHYPDADRQARIRVPQLEDEVRFKQLQRSARRGQLTPVGLAALAFGYSIRGDEANAGIALDAARSHAGRRTLVLRHVLWSAGWSYLNLGDYESAARAWTESAQLHGGQPFWLPYSMAVLAELDGQRELAIRWYAAAVRSQPRWGSAEGVARSTWYWQRKESEAMDRVFHAWRAAEEAKAAQGEGSMQPEAG